MTAISVAVLGLGAMGSRMALRLLAAGHRLTVWNRHPERAQALTALGATLADSPRAAVTDADFAICMTRDDLASRYIWLDADHGALAHLPPHCIALDSSTLSPAWARALGGKFEARQQAFLEAPVAGSLPQVEAGQLIYFIGGNLTLIAQVEPLLKALGNAMHHTGIVGSAAVVKLAINTMLAVQAASFAELLGLASKLGIDGAQLLAIFGATPLASPAIKFAGSAMVAKNYASNFPIELLRKDLGYLQHAVVEVGAGAPMLSCAISVLDQAIQQGLQHQNFTALAQIYQ